MSTATSSTWPTPTPASSASPTSSSTSSSTPPPASTPGPTGEVPTGTVVGVGTAFGLVAVGLALLLWLREKRWRRKFRSNGVDRLNSWGGPQSEAVFLVKTPVARNVTAAPLPVKSDSILAHQRTDNEILSPLRQLIAEINDLVQRFPNVPRSLSVEHVHGNNDAASILLVLPQLRRIEDLPGHLEGRIQAKQFLRGLVACLALETLSGSPQDDMPLRTDQILPARPAFSNAHTFQQHSAIVPLAASRGGDRWLPEDIRSSILTIHDAFHPQSPSSFDSGLEPNITAFHEWRAMTYTLLRNRYGDNYNEWTESVQDHIQARAEAIMRLLQPWVGSNSNRDQHQRSLALILIHALEFSCLLSRQRADWLLKFPKTTSGTAESKKGTVTFDVTTMKDFRSAGGEAVPASSTPVRIFIAPALFKCGNMDGEKYEDGYFLAQKAEVWCL